MLKADVIVLVKNIRRVQRWISEHLPSQYFLDQARGSALYVNVVCDGCKQCLYMSDDEGNFCLDCEEADKENIFVLDR